MMLQECRNAGVCFGTSADVNIDNIDNMNIVDEFPVLGNASDQFLFSRCTKRELFVVKVTGQVQLPVHLVTSNTKSIS